MFSRVLSATVNGIEAHPVEVEVTQHRASEYPPCAAKKLLATYNENWNEKRPISAGTFARRIWLYQLSFSPDGTAQLDYDDDDMFLGHSIAVHLDGDLNVSWVALAG